MAQCCAKINFISAKELEHYQRVRRSFEGVTHSPKTPHLPAASRIPAPSTTKEHLQPPALNKRPKPVSRTSTAKQTDPKGKGKGKATWWDSDDDDDEAYVTSNDFAGTPERKRSRVNGFGDVGGNDDEDIYG